jgi:hypothetical protein
VDANGLRIRGRSLRRGAFLAVLAAGVAALGGVSARPSVEPASRGASETADSAAQGPAPAAGLAVGSAAPRTDGSAASGSARGDGVDGASPDPAAGGPGATAADRALSPAEVLALAFRALAPGSVEDRLASGAFLPLAVDRSDLVGRVGPYGVRDPGAACERRWVGIAQVVRGDRATSAADDDPAAPATTAVRGVVVREDGTPIAGAEVILHSCFYVRQAFYDHHVRQIGRVFSDEGGAFDVRPLALDTVHLGAGGEVLVTVRHAGFPDLVAQPVKGIVPGRESDVGRFVLPEKGATIRGVVRDFAGHAVAGAVLRASGAFNPVEYDKTERMVVLDRCPSAVTDPEGRYVLSGFAPGDHEVSIHVHIDCVLHERAPRQGEQEWNPRVQAGNGVRGRVLDPDGLPVAAAVVAGGGNWTPTNSDGTFWLDNVAAGPLRVEVAHHAWHTLYADGVPTNGEDVVLTMDRLLARVTLRVVDGAEAPVPLVAIDWTWPPGGGPGRFAPDSRYWHDPRGVFRLVVPEGATGATVSDAAGTARPLAAADLTDGAAPVMVLAAPPVAR